MGYVPLSVSAPDTFSYVDGQTKFTEQLSHALLTVLSTLSTNDAQIPYTSLAETQAITTDMSSYVTSVITWIDGLDTAIATADAAGTEPTLDNPPALPVNPSEPLHVVIIKMVLKVVVEVVLAWLRNRKKNTGNKDISEVLQVLKVGLTQTFTDSGGTEHMISILQRIADENEMQITFNDGAISIWPKSMSIDFDEEAFGEVP